MSESGPTTSTVVFRPMRPDDVAAVAALERATFSAPWTEDTFLSLLRRAPVELLVAADGQEVVGYGVLWCIADEGELANIAVRGDIRGRGLGASLLDHLIETARQRGVKSLYLEVRPSNRTALRLYESRGFDEIGVRKGYYDLPPEDALVLCLRIGSGHAPP
jgi:[ribosomal protein S18]-alanine N-acetyltransferase